MSYTIRAPNGFYICRPQIVSANSSVAWVNCGHVGGIEVLFRGDDQIPQMLFERIDGGLSRFFVAARAVHGYDEAILVLGTRLIEERVRHLFGDRPGSVVAAGDNIVLGAEPAPKGARLHLFINYVLPGQTLAPHAQRELRIFEDDGYSVSEGGILSHNNPLSTPGESHDDDDVGDDDNIDENITPP